MTINQSLLDEIANEEFVSLAVGRFPEDGGSVIREIMETVIDVYKSVDLDAVGGPIMVVRQMDASSPELTGHGRPLRSFSDLQYLSDEGFTIELSAHGPQLWPAQETDICRQLSERAVVYLWDGTDTVWAGGEAKQPKQLGGLLSVFQRPVFQDLDEALEHYRIHLARTSRCKLLQRAWFDENRLYFKAKPESVIRDSVEQHLNSTLRDVEVRPEYTVDETHRVDLRVVFEFANRHALIEIKWLGKSKAEDGSTATEYPEARARDGARQLADYLDWNRERAPKDITRGYLVILDGRRRGLTEQSSTVSREDGFHYATAEIEYDPPYHETRDDFEIPQRMFAEPICT